MPLRLDQRDAGFEQGFRSFLTAKREILLEVDRKVQAIIAAVRSAGDAALIEYSLAFDKVALGSLGIAITASEVDAAVSRCEGSALDALEFAKRRIESFHRRQIPTDLRFTDWEGVELGWRWTPISAVGLYVPGGTASYPSTVLMNAIPARIAGVARLVMTVPAPSGVINPLVLAAARLCGIEEIYRIGGAQAIAALAYGTPSIAPVAKIVGPGNAYVAAAKRLVFGVVGIDMIAGPSEVLIIADFGGQSCLDCRRSSRPGRA